MLQIIEKKDLHQYVEDMYAIAIKAEQAAYPFWGDGLKTKEEFLEKIKRFENADEESDMRALLYLEKGTPMGYILYYLEDEKYIAFHCFCIKGDYAKAIDEFTAYVRQHYEGVTIWLGVSTKNTQAIGYFEKNGWKLSDDMRVNVFHFRQDTAFSISDEVIPVTPENFEDFRKVHSKLEGDMYWNCTHMLESLKKENIWEVFLWKEEGEPVAAIYNMVGSTAEIFGLDELKSSPEGCRELLKAALKAAQEHGARFNWFFTGEGEEELQKIVEEVGFEYLDHYVLHELTV